MLIILAAQITDCCFKNPGHLPAKRPGLYFPIYEITYARACSRRAALSTDRRQRQGISIFTQGGA